MTTSQEIIKRLEDLNNKYILKDDKHSIVNRELANATLDAMGSSQFYIEKSGYQRFYPLAVHHEAVILQLNKMKKTEFLDPQALNDELLKVHDHLASAMEDKGLSMIDAMTKLNASELNTVGRLNPSNSSKVYEILPKEHISIRILDAVLLNEPENSVARKVIDGSQIGYETRFFLDSRTMAHLNNDKKAKDLAAVQTKSSRPEFVSERINAILNAASFTENFNLANAILAEKNIAGLHCFNEDEMALYEDRLTNAGEPAHYADYALHKPDIKNQHILEVAYNHIIANLGSDSLERFTDYQPHHTLKHQVNSAVVQFMLDGGLNGDKFVVEKFTSKAQVNAFAQSLIDNGEDTALSRFAKYNDAFAYNLLPEMAEKARSIPTDVDDYLDTVKIASIANKVIDSKGDSELEVRAR